MINKEYKCFKVDISEHIANLVLSRPEQLNTMSRDFWVELGDVLHEINKDAEVRVVVMSSTGKHFCAGMDLNCLLYTSPSPRDRQKSRMPSSA